MERQTKKMTDRVISVILVCIMIFCLAGCGNAAPAIGEDVVVGNTEESGEAIVEPSGEDDTEGTKEETEIKDGEEAGASGEEEPVVTASPEPTLTATPEPTEPPHSHQYTETITRQPSCSEVGEKTLICSCGDSKTETVSPTGNHNWEAVYQTVVHPSTGHVEVSEVQVQVGTTTRSEYACAFCDARFDTPSGVVEHCKATGDRDHAMARTIIYDYSEPVYEMQTQSQWIVDTPEYTTQELVGYTCSICGATK